MAILHFSSGLGGSSGDTLATNAGPLLANKVVYVDSVTGNAAYSGLQRDRPLATIAQANAISAAGTIIVLLSTHAETIASNETISNARVVIVGEGSSSGAPTATITTNANVGLTLSGDGIQIRNVKFATSTAQNANPRVAVTGDGVKFVGCYFQCSGTDEDGAIDIQTGAAYCMLKSCTFISTATVQTDLPTDGVVVTGTGDGLYMDGCVFSDGTYGFSGSAFNGNGTLLNVHAENLSLLLGAVMTVGASIIGHIHVGTATGGGRVT